MAALTLWAEPASVLVVFFMARRTGRREDDLLDHWHGVAVMTLQPFVSAVEFEVGTGIVIEVPDFPVACIVTILTTASQLPTMDVVALMTRIAVDGGFVLVQDALMATVALRYTMLAEQRIFGVSIVLKGQGFPILLDMAAFASCAELPFMRIVLLMAGSAVARRLVLIQMPFMARGAFGRDMVPP